MPSKWASQAASVIVKTLLANNAFEYKEILLPLLQQIERDEAALSLASCEPDPCPMCAALASLRDLKESLGSRMKLLWFGLHPWGQKRREVRPPKTKPARLAETCLYCCQEEASMCLHYHRIPCSSCLDRRADLRKAVGPVIEWWKRRESRRAR